MFVYANGRSTKVGSWFLQVQAAYRLIHGSGPIAVQSFFYVFADFNCCTILTQRQEGHILMSSRINENEKVELQPAFSWTCPECGRENFHRGLVRELPPEEEQELRDEHGVQPWELGHFVTQPESVECTHCSHSFPTVDYSCDECD